MTYHDIFGLEEKKKDLAPSGSEESVKDPFGIGVKEPEKKEEK